MKNNFLDIVDYKKYMYSNYSKYLSTFIPIYLNELNKEYNALLNHFPDIHFETIARIKNPTSYFEKVDKKPGNYTFSDIYANKYVIYSVNGSKNEQLLIQACYEFYKFLIEYNNNCENILTEETDYISFPKPNNYQALHLKFQNTISKDFRFETQIKTEKMRWNEKFGEASHTRNYKKRHNISLESLPLFIKPVLNEDGSSTFKIQTKEDSFYEYYGFTYDEYLQNESR